MIELQGDLWRLPALARCITTNGDVDRDGMAIMGRGCALEAVRYDKTLKADLGRLLTEYGNHVFVLRHHPLRPLLLSFPVKHHWRQLADVDLIDRSAWELVIQVNALGLMGAGSVLVPRPGCGAGGLLWEDVLPVLAKHLDDRFVAVDFTHD